MELFIALFAGFSLLTGILLIVTTGLKQNRNAPPTVTQTELDEDQLLVVEKLGLLECRQDIVIINTQRTPDGTVLVFNVAIWWPLFNGVDTKNVTVLNVKPAGRYVMIGGTINL
jgi:hypothetical protein